MQSLEEIYQKYALRVYKYLLSLCHNEDVAEEITQETFYQAVKCIDRYDGSCAILTWLCAIAKNQLLAYQRKNPIMDSVDDMLGKVVVNNSGGGSWTKGELNVSAEEGQGSNRFNRLSKSAEETVMQSFDRIELMKRLHLCTEPFREVLYLRIFGNLSFREIGEIMGKTENWARVTFYRGKEKLRKEMSENEK